MAVLSDGVVSLRPWAPGDARALHTAGQDPDIALRIPIAQPYTLAEAQAFIRHATPHGNSRDGLFRAITDARTGRLLGSISRYGPVRGIASFGYWLAPGARGRGAATRALRLMSDWTFATTDAVSLEVQVVVGNSASLRVAERAGYVQRALLQAQYNERGVWRDCVILARDRPGSTPGSGAPWPRLNH